MTYKPIRLLDSPRISGTWRLFGGGLTLHFKYLKCLVIDNQITLKDTHTFFKPKKGITSFLRPPKVWTSQSLQEFSSETFLIYTPCRRRNAFFAFWIWLQPQKKETKNNDTNTHIHEKNTYNKNSNTLSKERFLKKKTHFYFLLAPFLTARFRRAWQRLRCLSTSASSDLIEAVYFDQDVDESGSLATWPKGLEVWEGV